MIPVIDLAEFPSQSHKLVSACKEWGCFRIINHQIPTTLMSEMKSVARSLLDLSPEIKRRNDDKIAGSGYVSPSEANPLFEGLGFCDIGSPEALHTFCSQLDASPQQRETILRYSEAVHELVMDLGRKIAESVGVPQNLFQGWSDQFRINKYIFTPEAVGSSALQMHTDAGFLTLLHDDDRVGGLEVMDRNTNVYVPVDPAPGSFVVNLGDLATVWSNGRLHNVKHRVQCKEASVRVSVGVFVGGPTDVAVEAPPELVDSEHPKLYVAVTVEEYKRLVIAAGFRPGEALALIRSTGS